MESIIKPKRPIGWHSQTSEPYKVPKIQEEAAREIERLRKDAERYRWMRKVYGAQYRIVCGSVYLAETPEELDAAIDAAMQEGMLPEQHLIGRGMETREEFENWAEAGFQLIRGFDGEYPSPLTNVAYRAWQARQPEIDALKAENERLRKDAERLEWLIENSATDGEYYEVKLMIPEPTTDTWRCEVRSQIDAAMQKPEHHDKE